MLNQQYFMANCSNISPFNLNLVKKAKLKKKLLIWVIFSPLCLIFVKILTKNDDIAVFSFIFVSFLIREFYYSTPLSKLFISGHIGEKNTLKVLKKLPKEFVIFNQIEIPSEDSSFSEFESDFIVVGLNSVFIIESKRFTSKVICEDIRDDWIKQEFRRDGTVKRRQFIKSPFRQVLRQKKYFLLYINHFDIKLSINTVIFLNMDKKDYKLPKNTEIPVFNNKSIRKFIKKLDNISSSFVNGYQREKLLEILRVLNQNSMESRMERLKDKKHFQEYFA